MTEFIWSAFAFGVGAIFGYVWKAWENVKDGLPPGYTSKRIRDVWNQIPRD